MDFLPAIILIALVWAGFRYIRPKSQITAPPARPADAPTVATPSEYRWPSIGDFDFEVVGESHYQEALRVLAGEHDECGASTACVADLIPDNNNPHDDKAVEVQVRGLRVGFLSRDDARSFRRRLGGKRLTGATTSCDAIIMGGGTRKNGERLMYGIQLDLKPFEG